MKHKQTMPEEKLTIPLDPTQVLCPIFDDVSILQFPVASRDEMGVRVLDNCCVEHQM